MSTDKVLVEAQDLNPDPLVELWRLDTTDLANVYGDKGTGSLYHWTPGVLNYRQQGTVFAGSTTTVIILDRLVTLDNTAIKYTLQVGVARPAGSFSAPIPITAFGVNAGKTTVTLFTPLSTAPAAGTVWLIESVGSVRFGGIEYTPMPIEVTDLEWSGQGKLPRPKLRVSNIGGLASALVIQFGDIIGATVIRTQTFKSFLDGEPGADPSAAFEADIFTVDRKSAHNKTEIEFELAAKLDQQGIALPKRLVLRNSCDQTYRQWVVRGSGSYFVYGSCPYVGAQNFLGDGTQTGDPAKDVCGKRLTDCLARFGSSAMLPFRGFPGAAEIKV